MTPSSRPSCARAPNSAVCRRSFSIAAAPARPGSNTPKQIDSFIWQILTRDLEHGDDPKVAHGYERYKAFTRKDASPNTYWGLTFYDTVFMMAKAMEEVGSVTDLKAIAAKVKIDALRRRPADALRQ